MKITTLLTGAAMAVLAGFAAHAQGDWPTKPIHILVPYGAGGGTDTTVRVLSPRASEILGQPIVVENRPGGATMIATQAVQSASPDGYTLGAAAAPLTLNPALGIETPYDPIEDLEHVIKLVDLPVCVIVHPDHPAQDFGEFVEWATAEEAPVLYATAGVGSMPHLWTEYLAGTIGFEAEHVGYRGSSPALLDVMAGNVMVMVDGYTPGCAQSKSGEVRALAVGWSERLPVLPEVPTIKELGYDVTDGAANFGLIAPKGTPQPIVEKINAAFNEALNDPAARETLENSGLLPAGGSPDDYQAFLRNEIERWSKVVEENGIEVQE